MELTLSQMVDEVRRDYFPRWDRGRRWQVREGARAAWVDSQGRTQVSSEAGSCQRDTRTISINSVDKLTIIHEICHAVAGGAHWQPWLDRMRKAASRADALGDAELAAQLQQEVEEYTGPNCITGAPAYVYGMVGDALLDVPELSFDALINHITYELALTPGEVHKRYRKLRAVYDEAQKYSRQQHELLAHWRAKIEGIPHGPSGRPAGIAAPRQ